MKAEFADLLNTGSPSAGMDEEWKFISGEDG